MCEHNYLKIVILRMIALVVGRKLQVSGDVTNDGGRLKSESSATHAAITSLFIKLNQSSTKQSSLLNFQLQTLENKVLFKITDLLYMYLFDRF